MVPMNPVQVGAALRGLDGWRPDGDAIRRTFTFPDFKAAIAFVNAVADAAEEACHHPDIDVRWNQVHLLLTTHDAGGLTDRDLVMAARFNELARSRGTRPVAA